MDIPLTPLVINRVIIHDVPRHNTRDESSGLIQLSEVESDLTDELRLVFREKIIGSIGSSDSDLTP